MSERNRKRLLWISLISLPIWIAGIVFFSVYLDTGTNKVLVKISEWMVLVSLIFSVLSALNLAVFFSFRFSESRWLKTVTLYSMFLLLPISTIIYYLGSKTNILDSGLAVILALTTIFILILLTLIKIFILRETSEIIGVMVLLILISLCIILQQLKILTLEIQDLFFPGFVIITAAGLYMFGLKCFFVIEKNSYLKNTSLITCTITAFGSFLFLLKMQGDSLDILELIYYIPAFLITLIVLLSLPFSGYINWSLAHKRILKKIAVSCIFFLLIFSLRFVYPDFFKLMIFEPRSKEKEFFMYDYELPDKNGLKPE